MKNFNYEEFSLISCYNPENGRLSMISTLTEELTSLEDELSVETARNALSKLRIISDEEFDTLDFINIFE